MQRTAINTLQCLHCTLSKQQENGVWLNWLIQLAKKKKKFHSAADIPGKFAMFHDVCMHVTGCMHYASAI